ncbi:SUMF1/EgtB/PvdO family nonheme iron enzyme [Arenimonas alkanexedens]
MKQTQTILFTAGVLACLLLAGCGREDAPDAAAPASAVPATVDPAELEAGIDIEEAPAGPAPEVPAWSPAIAPVAPPQFRETLRVAGVAIEEGRLVAALSVPPSPLPVAVAETGSAEADPESQTTAVEPEDPGALELYLGIVATEAEHKEANAGIDAITTQLIGQGRMALTEGRVLEGQQLERVVARARPQHPDLAGYRTAIESALRAQTLARLGDTRVRGNRIFKPEGKGAVVAYREALQTFPDFLPARDGLARLQATWLNRALMAAQDGDYPEAERLQAEAARILADSPALQDMAARIVELRQLRTEQLLAQGDAAVDALDLELAARRLAEAERASLQSRGLDALNERIELARHYGRFRPGQVFSDSLAAGGEAPEMVVLAHGRFRMGSPESEPDRHDNEGPQHEVAFDRGFAMARNEVTVGDFARFVEATQYRSVALRRGRSTVYDERGGVMSERRGVDWRSDHAGRKAAPELPVVHVAFEDAEAYVAWLSAQTGARYRLPTEAEFEYALRGGRDEAYAWGDGAPTRVVGNLTGDGDQSRLGRRWSNAIPDYSDGHWGPAPVRSFPAEAFGTFDMAGNVSEWVQDCWHDSYRRAPADGSAWVNPGCSDRVIRGASWASTLDRARSAYRQLSAAETTHARLGFRVVRDI